MKQTLSKILMMLFLMSSFIQALADYFEDDFEVDGIRYHILKDEMSACVDWVAPQRVIDDCGDVTIPKQVKLGSGIYVVTTIGSNVFYDFFGTESYKYLTSITIPNSVTRIGWYAFYCCIGLTSIEIPNSVTLIGQYAFSGCSSLTSIEIPNSVTSIEAHAFSYCRSLTSIEIPNSVTSIGEYTFRDCTSLTSIEIPNSVTEIRRYAFFGCSSLTSIEIPNSVTSIWDSAFKGCSSLTAIEIPNLVAEIGNGAFAGCSSLDEVKSFNIIPPRAYDTAFGGRENQIILYVPEVALDRYRETYPWSEFKDIRAIEYDSIKNIYVDNGITISTSNGCIDILNAPAMARVIVSALDGRVITAMYAETSELHIPLEHGVYIVKVGDTMTAKILI